MGQFGGFFFFGLDELDVGLLCADVESSGGVFILGLVADDFDLDALVAKMIVNQIILARFVLALINLDSAVDEVHEIKSNDRASDEQGVKQPNKEAKRASEAENSEKYVNLAFNAIHERIGARMKTIA